MDTVSTEPPARKNTPVFSSIPTQQSTKCKASNSAGDYPLRARKRILRPPRSVAPTTATERGFTKGSSRMATYGWESLLALGQFLYHAALRNG
jgi:hypothetical protein